MDMNRNKKVNRIVNMIFPLDGKYIYFSLKNMSISNKKIKNSTKISKCPVFDSAEKIMSILELNNVDFIEKDIKIL